MAIQCEKCGFLFYKEKTPTCFASKTALEQLKRDTCPNFFAVEYDGSVKLSPEEHMFLYRNAVEAKKMKNIQGMRF